MTTRLEEPARRPVNFVVHDSMYDEAAGAADVSEDLDTLVESGMRHHYCGATGADYWDALCAAPEYGHGALVRGIDGWFPHALRAAVPQGVARGRTVRLVSLGPGTGDMDVRMLAHLEAAFDEVAYACVDASFELLRRAVSRVARASELRQTTPIDAHCADFTQPCLAHHPSTVDLVSLLGGTIGNYREDEFVERLRKWLTPDARLLVDAWLWSPNGWSGRAAIDTEDARALVGGLTYPARNRFVFGPVEAATTATAVDVLFGHEVNRSRTVVPRAVNIITFCSDLHTRMRRTGAALDRVRLPLAATTRYDYDALGDWFGTVGFETVWRQHLGTAGVFLLRKR